MFTAGQGKIIFSFDVFYQKSIEFPPSPMLE